jgi:TolB protein
MQFKRLTVLFILFLWLLFSVKITPTAANSAQPKNEIILTVGGEKNKEILMLNLKTDQLVNLTNDPSDDMNPQVSPDGKSLVFYSDRSGTNQIYSMNIRTKKVTRLTNNDSEDFDPSYSPDGTLIVFKSTRDDGRGDIFTMRVDGSQQKNITPILYNTEEWDPTFSKNGTKIVFVIRKDVDDLTDEIYTMNIDGTKIQQLTKNKVADWYPSINPQTGTIVYVSKDQEHDTDALFTMNIDGSDKRVLSTRPGQYADPSWNTAGNRIIFINGNGKNYDLYIMQADGKNTKKIMSTSHDELSPVFLPTLRK